MLATRIRRRRQKKLLDAIKTRFYGKVYDHDANEMAKGATPVINVGLRFHLQRSRLPTPQTDATFFSRFNN